MSCTSGSCPLVAPSSTPGPHEASAKLNSVSVGASVSSASSPIPADRVAIVAYSAELAPKLQKIPDALDELLQHISATFDEVDKLVEKFERTVAVNESTAEKTTYTHEPLYKAKELIVQLVKDLISDDTHKSIVTPHLNQNAAAHLVTLAVVHCCKLAAAIVNKGAETSEAYRWILTGFKLIEKLQQSSPQNAFLTGEEMRACIDLKYIAKYTAAPVPDFFPKVARNTQPAHAESGTVTPVAGVSAMASAWALDLLVHAGQIWTLWTEPDNVGKVTDAAQRIISNVPETGGVTYKSAKDETQEGAEYYRLRQEEMKKQSGMSQKTNQNDASSPSSSSPLHDEHTKVEIEKLEQFQKSAAIQEAENMIRLETKRASRSKETVFVFVPPKWAVPYLRMKRHLGFIVTTPSRWRAGFLENHVFCEDRMLDIFTTIVQANRGNTNNPTSCYYSMLALQYRLPMVLHGGSDDKSLLDEWIGICLSLAEYYVDERDLSHVEHMMQVVDALMDTAGGARNALTSISTYKGYTTPNGVMANLLRLKLEGMKMKLFLDCLEEAQESANAHKQQQQDQKQQEHAAVASASPESKSAMMLNSSTSSIASSVGGAPIGTPQIADSTSAVVRMFQNEHLLPEEYNGMIVTASNLPANWSSKHVDTTKRISLIAKCADASLHSCVKPPAVSVTISYAELKDLAAANLKKFTSDGGFIIPELFKALNVNDDCERFVLSRRYASEFYGVIFTITRNVIVGEKRLQVLHELRNSALHENVFRNVLRQAEFDYGTQSVNMADLMPPTSEPRLKYLTQALSGLDKFCHSFERELQLAKDANVPIPLEGSDFVAYALGGMRKIETLLKLGGEQRQAEAGACATKIVEFATTYAKDGGERLAEMKTIAQELIAVLKGEVGKDKSGVAQSTAAATRAVEKKVVKKVVVVRTTHKDPSKK